MKILHHFFAIIILFRIISQKNLRLNVSLCNIPYKNCKYLVFCFWHFNLKAKKQTKKLQDDVFNDIGGKYSINSLHLLDYLYNLIPLYYLLGLEMGGVHVFHIHKGLKYYPKDDSRERENYFSYVLFSHSISH